jgi:hypothetical protein
MTSNLEPHFHFQSPADSPKFESGKQAAFGCLTKTQCLATVLHALQQPIGALRNRIVWAQTIPFWGLFRGFSAAL